MGCKVFKKGTKVNGSGKKLGKYRDLMSYDVFMSLKEEL